MFFPFFTGNQSLLISLLFFTITKVLKKLSVLPMLVRGFFLILKLYIYTYILMLLYRLARGSILVREKTARIKCEEEEEEEGEIMGK